MNNCFVCEKPLINHTLTLDQQFIYFTDGVEYSAGSHINCGKYHKRIEKAKKVIKRAEEEIESMQFAIFLRKTHPVSIDGT